MRETKLFKAFLTGFFFFSFLSKFYVMRYEFLRFSLRIKVILDIGSEYMAINSKILNLNLQKIDKNGGHFFSGQFLAIITTTNGTQFDHLKLEPPL